MLKYLILTENWTFLSIWSKTLNSRRKFATAPTEVVSFDAEMYQIYEKIANVRLVIVNFVESSE